MIRFDIMYLPKRIPLAVPIEHDGRIDARLLIMMRDMAWYHVCRLGWSR